MKVTFVGGGKLTTSMLQGFKRSGVTDFNFSVLGRQHSEENIRFFGKLNAEYTDNRNVVADAEIILLMVRPQQSVAALCDYKSYIANQTLISFVSGLNAYVINKITGLPYNKIITSTGNTNGAYGAAVIASAAISDEQKNIISTLFQPLIINKGCIEFIHPEQVLPAVTAIGSLNAFDIKMVELCWKKYSLPTKSLEGYVQEILNGAVPDEIGKYLVARKETLQYLNMDFVSERTWLSALYSLYKESDPALLIKRVVTPNGCTAAGIEMATVERLSDKGTFIPILESVWNASKSFTETIDNDFRKLSEDKQHIYFKQ